MFFVCILDVSPPMQQQTVLGLTLLECAKSGMEQLITARRQEGQSARDQYMLLITSSLPLIPPSSSSSSPGPDLFPQHTQVVCGWHDNHKFTSSLKAVQPPPSSLPAAPAPSSPLSPSWSYLSSALTSSLDLLNKFSRPNGIDNFGKGRIPWYNEPAALLLFTTDQPLPAPSSALPLAPAPAAAFEWMASTVLGSQFASTPFRWDQRVFPCVLRVPLRHTRPGLREPYQSASASSLSVTNARAASPPQQSPSELSLYLQAPAEQTGGKVFIAPSLRLLLSHVDSLATRPSPHFSLHLHPALPATATPSSDAPVASLAQYASDHVGVYVKATGTWPIPETFASTAAMTSLPLREPHPTLFFDARTQPLPTCITNPSPAAPSAQSQSSPTASLPSLESAIPHDTYTLEPTIKLAALLYADEPGTCRWVYAHESAGVAFGVLTANRAKQKLSLILLPYDFPVFFQLLARIDAHLRSLPLTSSSSAALQAAPGLYRELSTFLARIPAYCSAPLQALLAKQPRLPRLEVKAGEQGVLSAEVSELMKGWKDRARAMMALEKEQSERERAEDAQAKHHARLLPFAPRPIPLPSSARPDAVHELNGSAAPARKRKRAQRKSRKQSEVDALISGRLDREAMLVPSPDEAGTVEEEDREGGLRAVFLLPEEALDARLAEWRARAWAALDSSPLLAHAFPPPRPPAPSVLGELTPRSLGTAAADSAHALPIAAIGDYQQHLRLHPPLRSVDEGAGMGSFGSPFRKRVEEEGVEEKDVMEGRRADDAAAASKGKGKKGANKDRLADWLAKRAEAAAKSADEQRSSQSAATLTEDVQDEGKSHDVQEATMRVQSDGEDGVALSEQPSAAGAEVQTMDLTGFS